VRDDLRGITEKDYWLYGLRESDLDYILRLADALVEARKTQINEECEQAKEDYPDPSIHGEIISDLSHYAWVDEQYIWQFCLGRFQGILEGLIVSEFLSYETDQFLPGLKSKLRAVRDEGYQIENSEYDELLEWAKLRNALSHAPPEQFRPGPLRRSDVVEYKQLIKSICATWREANAEL
jgi:hypothetical protein